MNKIISTIKKRRIITVDDWDRLVRRVDEALRLASSHDPDHAKELISLRKGLDTLEKKVVTAKPNSVRPLVPLDGTDWYYDYTSDTAMIDGREFVPKYPKPAKATTGICLTCGGVTDFAVEGYAPIHYRRCPLYVDRRP